MAKLKLAQVDESQEAPKNEQVPCPGCGAMVTLESPMRGRPEICPKCMCSFVVDYSGKISQVNPPENGNMAAGGGAVGNGAPAGKNGKGKGNGEGVEVPPAPTGMVMVGVSLPRLLLARLFDVAVPMAVVLWMLQRFLPACVALPVAMVAAFVFEIWMYSSTGVTGGHAVMGLRLVAKKDDPAELDETRIPVSKYATSFFLPARGGAVAWAGEGMPWLGAGLIAVCLFTIYRAFCAK